MRDLVRDLTEADWPQVAALEAEAYAGTGLTEGEAGLRCRAAPGTSFVLDLDGRTAGYVLALPHPAFHPPALTRAEQEVHHLSANLHLHDLVVSAPLRRRGLGTHLVRHLADTARSRGFTTMSLVAVAGKEPFWRRHGYRPHPGTPLPPGYGGAAVYMSTRLTAARRAG